MKIFLIFIVILFIACSDVSNQVNKSVSSITCEINFHSKSPCIYEKINVSINTETIETDEKLMKSLDVLYKGKRHQLNITPDTTLLEGDRGYISFADINFDGESDIAITTSFGVANLYLDYWVFDATKNQFIYLGNHSEFKMNSEGKTLSNITKINAANYEKKRYKWDKLKLVIVNDD